MKMRFPLKRESNFHIFLCLKLSYLLDPQKHRFWLRFGGQVGTRNRPCWLQEASCADFTAKKLGPKMMSKNELEKMSKKRPQTKTTKNNKIVRGGSLKSNQSKGSTGPTQGIGSLHFVPRGARWRIYLKNI